MEPTCKNKLSNFPFLTGCTNSNFVIPVLYYNGTNYQNYNITFQDFACGVFDNYVSGATLNGYDLILTRTDGTNMTINLFDVDTFLSAGTYSNGFIYFSGHNTNFAVDVSALLDDTNTYVTGSTLDGSTLTLTRNDGVQISTDLTPLLFTGNTSGSCISDLYVHNLGGCSPIILQTGLKSNTAIDSNDTSFAFGENAVATGNTSFAFGYNTRAEGNYSYAEGYATTASGNNSHAEGTMTIASEYGAHAEGRNASASAIAAHAEGFYTIASGDYSHAEGYGTTASGSYGAHAEGQSTIASGYRSHAEGVDTTASGHSSHAEGNNTTASAYGSHAEGQLTTASGTYSHAEGSNTTASGYASHAEGRNTIASGYASHAEGVLTTASGDLSHAEGNFTTASGTYSHVGGQGYQTGSEVIASGTSSFNHSYTDGTAGASYALGNYSAILGGVNNNVYGERSVVLGGTGITGYSGDTVYVPKIEIIETTNQIIMVDAVTGLRNSIVLSGGTFIITEL